MRAVYLVRHGRPETPDGRRWCYGRTDLPLSEAGRAEARALGAYFGNADWALGFTSPLRRSADTAAGIPCAFTPCPDFTELDMGDWDGLPFDEIVARWPEQFAARRDNFLTLPPPGGEDPAAFRARVTSAFRAALEAAPERDLLLVTHNAVNAVLLASLLGGRAEERLQPCASVTQLLLDGDDVTPGPAGCLPDAMPPLVPDEGDCRALLAEASTPPRAAEHCRAVAEKAARMAEALNAHGHALDPAAAFAGGHLHDIAKGQIKHAVAGAKLLTERGYARMAAIVGDHMHLPAACEGALTEKTVVFLADKLVKETHSVTLEERYFSDAAPDKAPYREAHYRQAKRLLALYEAAIS